MYSTKFNELKDAYSAERKLKISEDQFAVLVYTFPSVLVAHADGKIDRKERKFMKALPEVLTEEYPEDIHEHASDAELTDDYFKEVNYLTKNLDTWEQPFLDALKEELHNGINERNAIFRSMWRTADSSKDISAEERKKIDYITGKLGL